MRFRSDTQHIDGEIIFLFCVHIGFFLSDFALGDIVQPWRPNEYLPNRSPKLQLTHTT